MALPTVGPISMSQIQTEFGGSNPISLSEYYSAAAGIPASGTISMNQFLGTSALKEFTSADLVTTNNIQPIYVSGKPSGSDFYVESRGISLYWGARIDWEYNFSGVRYSNSQYTTGLTNLFSVANISAADVGKNVEVWYDGFSKSRVTNGTDDTGIIYDTVAGAFTVSYAANGTNISNGGARFFSAGTISAADNGSVAWNVNHATNQGTGSTSGRFSGGMTLIHNFFKTSGDNTTPVLRIT